MLSYIVNILEQVSSLSSRFGSNRDHVLAQKL